MGLLSQSQYPCKARRGDERQLHGSRRMPRLRTGAERTLLACLECNPTGNVKKIKAQSHTHDYRKGFHIFSRQTKKEEKKKAPTLKRASVSAV